MKVDNQRNTYRLWISRLVMAIVFTLVIIVLIFVPWFEESDFWLTEYHMMVLVGLIYVVLNTINYLKVPYFVSYSDHGEMIILRYYPLSLFTSRKHSIEIPKQQFVKFELKPFMFGSQHYLILHQNFRGKVANYPR
ncbi:MAG: hypothetical protein KAT15_14555, partial [Bacteroidales bacterium]|nr:hypothetical protein [Bacteroidales bacterium]